MKLYRFERPELRRIDTLERGYIWMSRPQYFNDLYDCQLPLNSYSYGHFSESALKDAASLLYSDLSASSRDYFISEEFIESVRTWAKSRRSIKNPKFLDVFYDKVQQLGIQAFTELDYKNPLMWAHYAKSNEGFCIEYELHDSALGKFYFGYGVGFSKLNYTSEKVEFDFREILLMPVETAIRYVTHKSAPWAYENEMRLIYTPTPDQKERYGYCIKLPGFLKVKAIYAGPRCKPKMERRLIQCAKNLKIPFHRVDMHPLSLDLEIVHDDPLAIYL